MPHCEWVNEKSRNFWRQSIPRVMTTQELPQNHFWMKFCMDAVKLFRINHFNKLLVGI